MQLRTVLQLVQGLPVYAPGPTAPIVHYSCGDRWVNQLTVHAVQSGDPSDLETLATRCSWIELELVV